VTLSLDPLNVAYFHFMWVLKLLTSHKCHSSHPVQICHSNCTHFLTSFQWSPLLANGHHYRLRKSFTARIGGPTWPEDCFLSKTVFFLCKGGEKWPNQELSIDESRNSHTISAQCWPPPPSCPFCWHWT